MDLEQLGQADPITRPYWEGVARRTLMVQRCAACGRHQFYPRQFCTGCETSEPEWVAATGRGTVYSRTVIHRPNGTDAEPYTNALVDLDEGVRLFTSLADSSIAIGDRVQVAWRELADGVLLPEFVREGGIKP